MADHISITVDDRAAQAMFARLEFVGKKMPMRHVASELYMLVRQTFYYDQADPWGKQWPPLSPLTLKARRRRRNASGQILLDSEKLWASIKDGHTDFDATVTAGEGLSNPRAVVHQFGTSNAGRSRNVRIEARPFFPMRKSGPDIPDAWWPRLLMPVEKAIQEATA